MSKPIVFCRFINTEGKISTCLSKKQCLATLAVRTANILVDFGLDIQPTHFSQQFGNCDCVTVELSVIPAYVCVGPKRVPKQGEEQGFNNRGTEGRQNKTEWRTSFREYRPYGAQRQVEFSVERYVSCRENQGSFMCIITVQVFCKSPCFMPVRALVPASLGVELVVHVC